MNGIYQDYSPAIERVEYFRRVALSLQEAATPQASEKPPKQTGKPKQPGRPRLENSSDEKARLTANLYANIRSKKAERGITEKELLTLLKADPSILELAKVAGKTIDKNLVKAACKSRTKSATSTK